MIFTLLTIPFLIALILLIWFKSDAFIEWIGLFRLGKLIKLDEYRNKKLLDSNVSLTYPMFLKTTYKNFIFKILGCPLCLSVWISFFSATVASFITVISFNITMTFLTLLVLLFGFVIIYTPIICIISLYIYGKIAKILNEDK